MSLIERLTTRFLAPTPAGEPPKEGKRLPQRETAFIGLSNVMRGLRWEQYNPDQLIGQKGYGIYRKMMLDEQVKAVVHFRRDAITARDWYFEIDSADMDKEEKDERIGLANSWVEQMESPKFQDAMNGIMSSIYHGYSMTEKTFKQIEWRDKVWWGIRRLRLKPYDTFYFHVDDYGDLLRVTQKIQGVDHEVDYENFIHFVNQPDVDEYYGQSELREAYRAWYSKDNAWKLQMIWLERHAGGFLIAQPKDDFEVNENSPLWAALQNVLMNHQTGASMILPGGIEAKMEWPVANVAFQEAIDMSDFAIAKALLVPNLLGVTPETDTGSLARAETQLKAFVWTLASDAKRLVNVLNDHVFELLGEVNFGGSPEEWPRFAFKPLSDEEIHKTLDKWKEMIGARAVKLTEKDEAYIRDLLNFPDRTDDDELLHDPADAPTIPRPGGGEDDEDTGTGEEPPQPGQGQDPETGGPVSETISGRGGKVSISTTMRRAVEGRVDFTTIARRSEDVATAGTKAVTLAADSVTRELMAGVDAALDGGRVTAEEDDNPDPDEAIDALRVPRRLKGQVNKAIRTALRAGWDIGMNHAAQELDKVKGLEATVKSDRVRFVREEFFNIRSFAATGRVIDDITNVLHNVILQAAKAQKTNQQVREDLVAQLTARGLIGEELVKEVLGAVPQNIKAPNARLDTMIRTVTFEAINEARFTAFTDPGLGGFVQALEYSAVLDSRTTQVCQHMDGRVFRTDSDVWTGPVSWRPPNHFNCRSLLIAVTERDTFNEAEFPTVQPQEGFG